MRVLSLSRPWPWAIFDPVARKHTEFRNWMPPVHMIGQTIALHAAKSWDHSAVHIFAELGLDHVPMRYDAHPFGVIVGTVTLDRVVTEMHRLSDDQQRWWRYGLGTCAWCLLDVRALPVPVPCRGAQGLRELHPDIDRRVVEQLT